jgi:hypothetical protein
MSELLTEGLNSIEQMSLLLRSYTEILPLQAAEIECLYDLVAARHAVTLLVHAWRSQYDPSGAGALQSSVAHALGSLERLRSLGGGELTAIWHEAAGTLPPAVRLQRRRARLLGAGAELFYEEPLHIVRGEDVWLVDAAGRRYLDVYNNVAHVGHAHPTVGTPSAGSRRRSRRIVAICTRGFSSTPRRCARACRPISIPAFSSIRAARPTTWPGASRKGATGRSGALIMEHAYHGITDAVAALSPAAGEPQQPWVATLAAPPPGLRAAISRPRCSSPPPPRTRRMRSIC